MTTFTSTPEVFRGALQQGKPLRATGRYSYSVRQNVNSRACKFFEVVRLCLHSQTLDVSAAQRLSSPTARRAPARARVAGRSETGVSGVRVAGCEAAFSAFSTMSAAARSEKPRYTQT